MKRINCDSRKVSWNDERGKSDKYSRNNSSFSFQSSIYSEGNQHRQRTLRGN